MDSSKKTRVAKRKEGDKKVSKKRTHSSTLMSSAKKILKRYVESEKPLTLKKETKKIIRGLVDDMIKNLAMRLMVFKQVEGTKTVSVDTLMRASSTFLAKKKMDDLTEIVASTLKAHN